MQSFEQHHRRVLCVRLRNFPAAQLQVWLQLREIHGDVANQVALWAFALPVAHPVIDSWIAQIHRVWRQHFRVRECYDGVVFLPQREALLKRPVLALFQHRHVAHKVEVGCNLEHIDMWLHGLSIRFYGNPRDVERMKQRTWNVLGDDSPDFCVRYRYGSMLQLTARMPTKYYDVCHVSDDGVVCLDRDPCNHRWTTYPNYDFMHDEDDRRKGRL